MSFPKAKLTRFNDIKASTPSPADYNVLLQNKAKLGKIAQGERFSESQASSVSDTSSNHSQSNYFRTPTLLKKKKLAFKLKEPSDDGNEELKEKIIECSNKDLYIKELTDQAEELKSKVAHLQKQKNLLESEKKMFERKMRILEEERANKLQGVILRHRNEFETIRSKIVEINNERKFIEEKCEVLKFSNKREIRNLLGNVEKFQDLFNKSSDEFRSELQIKNDLIQQKDEEIKKLKKKCADLNGEYSKKIQFILEKYKCDRIQIKNKMVESMKKINEFIEKEKVNINQRIKLFEMMKTKEMNDEKKSWELEKQKIQQEKEATIKLFEENFKEVNLLNDIQTKEKIEDIEKTWKIKLDEQDKMHQEILKECQEISEFTIIQTEMEKNKLKKLLANQEKINEKLMLENEEINKNYKNLEENFSKVQNNWSETTKKLGKLRQQHMDEIKKQETNLLNIKSENKTYEITITTTQETIEVLKTRLINSDRDVEQLKEELSNCEKKILILENKCGQLNSELKQTQTNSEELEMQYESSLKIMATNIEKVQSKCLQDIEDYKNQVGQQTKQLKEEKIKFNEVFQQLTDQLRINSEIQLAITKMGQQLLEMEDNSDNSNTNEKLQDQLNDCLTENKISEDKIEELKRQVVHLQEKSDSYQQYCEYYKSKVSENERELDEAAEIRKKYIDQSGKYDELIQQFEIMKAENEKQKKKIEEQELLIGPFRDQLESYEIERNKLLNQKRSMANEVEEVSRKYAEILGHQNNKQKIKHLNDLKDKHVQLQQKKDELELKVAKYEKSISKLRRENSDLKKLTKKIKPRPEDKENMRSPNRSLNSSKIESPGPLRERN